MKSMPIEDRVQTVATVREVLGPRTCLLTLPNGKQVFGFAKAECLPGGATAGVEVRIELSVADFSRACVLGAAPLP